jgi:16S rRNA (cytosine967-C5)-methyltransferase
MASEPRESPKKIKNKGNAPTEAGLAARFLAFESLQDSTVKNLPTDRIWVLAEQYQIPSREKAFAYELLAGTIKRRAALDHLIEVFSSRSTRQMSSDILSLLRIGVYQLVYEDKVPDFAAVDTTCRLGKYYLKKTQIGFINAILRNIQRGIETRNVEIDAAPNDHLVPITQNRGVKFSTPVLANLKTPGDYLATAYSHPKWLVARWLEKWEFEILRGILAAGNARPALVCRPNPLKTTPRRLVEILAAQDCRVEFLADDDAVELLENPPMTELPAYAQGLFQIQDPTAGRIARQLAPKPGTRILDLCAGLGTKTTQLAELADDRAQVFAADRVGSKLEKLKLNAARLGIKSITTLPLEALNAPEYKEFFDIVLLDVPCSNTGVFDRRPEARWRLKETDFKTYARQSLDLLTRAQALVNPAGRIAFSTCSIDEEENLTLIQSFTKTSKWQIQNHHLHLPELNPAQNKTRHSGGFWAILKQP